MLNGKGLKGVETSLEMAVSYHKIDMLLLPNQCGGDS